METTEQNYSALGLDLTNRSYLSEAARWGKFLSIIGFVMCGFLVVISFFIGTIMTFLNPLSQMDNLEGMDQNSMEIAFSYSAVFLTVLYLLIALLYFFPCLFLFRFADKMQLALKSEESQYLSTAFLNLKSLFKFMGILTIVVLCFYVLGILIVVFTAASFL